MKSLTTQFVLLFCVLLLANSSAEVHAYNPPIDKQGPLTATIEGPDTITDLDAPFPVTVRLKNDAIAAVSGTLTLSGIDGWECDPSAELSSAGSSFRVDANSELKVEFEVTPGPNVYAAHYPLHAIAEFDAAGKHFTVHPIFILLADVPKTTAERPELPWQPFEVADHRSVSLWQLPVFRTVAQVFGQRAQATSVGRTGPIEPHRGTVERVVTVNAGDESYAAVPMHPPWFAGQTGTILAEYPLRLPADTKVTLKFASAMTTEEGDGVTFRVRAVAFDTADGVLGDVLGETHCHSKMWQSHSIDLSSLSGQTIRLQLESHPGPANNTSFDRCLWGEPTLIVGEPLPQTPFPTEKQNLALRNQNVDIHLGQRGLLDASIGFSDEQGSRLWINGFHVSVNGLELHDSGAPITLLGVRKEKRNDCMRFVHTFADVLGSFDLVGEVSLGNRMLSVKWSLENEPPYQPWKTTRIESISIGHFDRIATRVYAGHGNVIEEPKPFRLHFDGHRLSTSFVGLDFGENVSLLQAVDLPPTELDVDPDQHRYALKTTDDATFTLLFGDNVWDLCKRFRQHNGLQAASGVENLAGRFAFDVWGGRYDEANEKLKRAFRYGMTDSVVVWHNWQRFGYDYRLPEIYPPNPQYGNEAELRSMIESCRAADVLFALHDNYIDYYPDAEGFSYSDKIAFDQNQQPVKAWINEYRGARSYRYRADAVAPILQNNVNQIQVSLAPSAYFIDVWSSIRPYDYWTEAGQYFDARFTRDSWCEHFAWIREKLGDDAVQISESGTDQLIGFLDGAQTNHLRVGNPVAGSDQGTIWDLECKDAERIPWFDAAHHDRFALHGAGYSSRYQAGLDAAMHGIYSDDYIATEILTGHPGMVSEPFSRDAVRKYWLTQDLARALALQTIEGVEFVDHDIHHQIVSWDDVGSVIVNRGAEDWTINNLTLPQYGFSAQLQTPTGPVSASVYRQDGMIVERAESPNQLYVNARSTFSNSLHIKPRVAAFSTASEGRVNLTIEWQMKDPVPTGYVPFLHFVDQESEIAFQASFAEPFGFHDQTGTITMRASARVPNTYGPNETFELRTGFYDPLGHRGRLGLIGNEDGERRIRLGRLSVSDDSAKPLAWVPLEDGRAPFLARNNVEARPVDFGYVVTAGSCRLTRDENAVVLMPLPNENARTTDWQLRWERLPWTLPKPTTVTAINESGEQLWQRPLGEIIQVEHEPGVFAYRLD